MTQRTLITAIQQSAVEAWGNTVTISHSTIYNNSGGISSRGSLRIDNSIIAGNTRAGLDLAIRKEVPPDVNHSIVGNAIGSGLAESPLGFSDENGNLVGGPVNGDIDPLLGELRDHGGPSLTLAIHPGSPAIDAGNPAAVAGLDGVPVYDQRGEPFTRVFAGRIDIGAFEAAATQGRL